jgi:hypothetical protein
LNPHYDALLQDYKKTKSISNSFATVITLLQKSLRQIELQRTEEICQQKIESKLTKQQA